MNVRLAPVCAIFFITLAIGAAPVSASLIWEFGYTDEVNGFSGTGSFTLGATSSTNISDVLAFSYSGTCAGLQCDFDLSSLEAAVWEIDSNWNFTSFTIAAASFRPDPFEVFQLAIFGDRMQSSCRTINRPVCNGLSFDGSGQLFYGAGAFLSPVHEAVPVPAAAWLFGSALLGLAAVKRRKA